QETLMYEDLRKYLIRGGSQAAKVRRWLVPSCGWAAICWFGISVCLADDPATPATTANANPAASSEAKAKWDEIKQFFVVPDEYRGKLGKFRSLLTFDADA